MSLSTWKLENDLCRCCHAEGSFYNLSEPRSVLGQTEVYSEMLKNCFDIELPPVVGMMCTVTYTICETCVRRLRDANDFKQQVLLNEQRFRDLYKNSIKNAFNQEYGGVKDESTETFEIDVKQEYVVEENDDFHVKYESEDDLPVINIKDSQNEHLIQIKIEEKKSKSKSKAEKKPKKTKKVPKTKIIEDKVERVETVDKGKGSKEKWMAFTLTTNATGLRGYTCNECQRTFYKRNHFSQHYKYVHLKQRPKTFQCKLCYDTFTSKDRAKHMEEKHGREAPRCHICDKTYSHQYLLIQHQRICHLGEKDYKCELCDYRCGTSKMLKRHQVKHDDARQFVCELCDKAFKYRKNLKVHIAALHPKRHCCPLCYDRFQTDADMKYHIDVEHPELF